MCFICSGLGHIKFWKMASTFTGLKLQGELGRFGKSEICDIVGIFGMPDEKVSFYFSKFEMFETIIINC